MKYLYQTEFKTVATPYLFIVTPFILLILVKVLTGKYEDLLLTGDWSIASAMIYSSSVVNVRSATRKYKGKLNEISFDWFMATTSVMSAISVTIYVVALIQPNKWIGFLQILLFVVASLSHMKYGRLAYRLRGEES